MTLRVVVASRNPDKVAEVEAVLRDLALDVDVVRGLDWPDVPETEPDLTGNALLKAAAVMDHTGLPVIADDTGLEVTALDGEPGVRSARYAGEDATYADNVALLLRNLEGAADRSARFRTVVVYAAPGEEPVVAEGVLAGTITTEPRGSRGFGYDPVFEVGGRTLAEMTNEEKNRISHRARALHALANQLAERA